MAITTPFKIDENWSSFMGRIRAVRTLFYRWQGAALQRGMLLPWCVAILGRIGGAVEPAGSWVRCPPSAEICTAPEAILSFILFLGAPAPGHGCSLWNAPAMLVRPRHVPLLRAGSPAAGAGSGAGALPRVRRYLMKGWRGRARS